MTTNAQGIGRRCAECGESRNAGQTCEWVAATKVGERKTGSAVNVALTPVDVYEVTYTEFMPIQVFLCESCYRKARTKSRRSFLIWILVSLPLSVLWLYVFFFHIDTIREIPLLNALGLVLTLAAVANPAAAVFITLTRFLNESGAIKEVHDLLRPYVEKAVSESGRTHFFTRAEFERTTAKRELL
jgi:hypothetical protein